MNIEYLNLERRVQPRASVLRKLGIANLVSTAKFDIAAAHEALVRRQAVPERICADGLVVDVPAGVYHPLPDSSSEFFIRNIKAINPNLIAKTLEIGCGCGIISLFIAANWTSRTVAADISPIAVEATIANAQAEQPHAHRFSVRPVREDRRKGLRPHHFQYAIGRQEPGERHREVQSLRPARTHHRILPAPGAPSRLEGRADHFFDLQQLRLRGVGFDRPRLSNRRI